jgi:ParB family chromosome partitioning protein
MSKAADNLHRRFGANLSESLGVRTAPAAIPDGRFPGEIEPPSVGPDDGRTRAREAGHMEIDRIVPDPDQPRKEFSPDAIERLAQSLLKHGQLMPIRVRWSQGAGKWVVISGERRYRAAIQAGLKTVACIFTDGNLTPSEILQEQLIENLLREDLKPVEAARAYKQLMEAHGWTAKELSAELHISQGAISKAISLLTLPEDLQHRVDEGELAPSAAYAVARVENEAVQRQLAERIVAENLTRDDASRAARRAVGSAGKSKGRGATRGNAKGKTARLPSEIKHRGASGSRIVVHTTAKLTIDGVIADLKAFVARLEAEMDGATQDAA